MRHFGGPDACDIKIICDGVKSLNELGHFLEGDPAKRGRQERPSEFPDVAATGWHEKMHGDVSIANRRLLHNPVH